MLSWARCWKLIKIWAHLLLCIVNSFKSSHIDKKKKKRQLRLIQMLVLTSLVSCFKKVNHLLFWWWNLFHYTVERSSCKLTKLTPLITGRSKQTKPVAPGIKMCIFLMIGSQLLMFDHIQWYLVLTCISGVHVQIQSSSSAIQAMQQATHWFFRFWSVCCLNKEP